MRFCAKTRKMRWLGPIRTVMVGMVVLCGGSMWAQVPPLFKITVSAPQTVEAGTEIRVHVVLKNISDRVFFVDTIGGPSLADINFSIFIHDAMGNEIPKSKLFPNGRPRAGSAGFISVQPGETLEQDAPLSYLYDMNKPGQYFVHITRSASDASASPGPHRSDPRNNSIVSSNEVTITVLPAKKPQ